MGAVGNPLFGGTMAAQVTLYMARYACLPIVWLLCMIRWTGLIPVHERRTWSGRSRAEGFEALSPTRRAESATMSIARPTRSVPQDGAIAQKRPCPRCFVTLERSGNRTSRGLTGLPSSYDIYSCPACDARYEHRHGDGRWRSLD
jgi:hypothetical protein